MQLLETGAVLLYGVNSNTHFSIYNETGTQWLQTVTKKYTMFGKRILEADDEED